MAKASSQILNDHAKSRGLKDLWIIAARTKAAT